MRLDFIFVRVGTTTSGKVIPYSPSIERFKSIIKYFRDPSMTPDDLFEALSVFEYLFIRARQRGDESESFNLYFEEIKDLMGSEEFETTKLLRGMNSAFDLRDLGESLVSFEFLDF